jgi:hypothetical protein
MEAVRGEKTLNQLGSHFGVHFVLIAQGTASTFTPQRGQFTRRPHA